MMQALHGVAYLFITNVHILCGTSHSYKRKCILHRNISDVITKQDLQDYQDLLVCRAEMVKKEKRETMVVLVSRESQDNRVTLEFLDFLYVVSHV